MVNEHMKRYSTLVIKEMQIKFIMRFHFTPTMTARIKKFDNNKVSEDMGTWNPHTLLVRNLNCVATLENNLAPPQRVKHRVTT